MTKFMGRVGRLEGGVELLDLANAVESRSTNRYKGAVERNQQQGKIIEHWNFLCTPNGLLTHKSRKVKYSKKKGILGMSQKHSLEDSEAQHLDFFVEFDFCVGWRGPEVGQEIDKVLSSNNSKDAREEAVE